MAKVPTTIILSEIFMFLASRITDLWALICTILNCIEYSQNNSAETLLDGENNVAGQELTIKVQEIDTNWKRKNKVSFMIYPMSLAPENKVTQRINFYQYDDFGQSLKGF